MIMLIIFLIFVLAFLITSAKNDNKQIILTDQFKISHEHFINVRTDEFTNEGTKKIFKAPISNTRILNSSTERKNKSKPRTATFEELVDYNLVNTYKIDENIVSYPTFFHVDEKWPGCLPRPLYQGKCGSCWGFAAVTALSSRFYIESCGIAGCFNYPQINFGSLNKIYDAINRTYKFRKLNLENVFKYLDTNRNKKITREEWMNNIMSYSRAFNSIGTSLSEKHNIVQTLIFVLNFQSLGSINLFDKEETEIRASLAFDVWLDYINREDYKESEFSELESFNNNVETSFISDKNGTSFNNNVENGANSLDGSIDSSMIILEDTMKNKINEYIIHSMKNSEKISDYDKYILSTKININTKKEKFAGNDTHIDIEKLEKKWMNEPITISAEKIIACCADCVKREFESKNSEDLVGLSMICIGGSLEDGWGILKDMGVPTATCIGYNMDSYVEGDLEPTCGMTQGPHYSFCSGYSIIEKNEDLFDILDHYQKENVDPIAIPGYDRNLPWIDPQLFVFRAKNVYRIKNDEHLIQKELMERGPITTGFHLYPDFQEDFGTDGFGGQKFISGTNPLGSTSKSLIYMNTDGNDPIGGHAITIIGWGTYIYEIDMDPTLSEAEKNEIDEKFKKMGIKYDYSSTQPSSTQPIADLNQYSKKEIAKNRSFRIPYWICLNSWGYLWGHSGFSKVTNRNKEPFNLKNGGYFWILRGYNECDIENNVVVGQPDLLSISYTGIVDKYGWGLPPPDKEALVPQKKVQTYNDTKFIYLDTKEGGGTYTTRLIDNKIHPLFKDADLIKYNDIGNSMISKVDEPEASNEPTTGPNEEPNNTWIFASMEPPSPFTMFWDTDRPVYYIGTVTELLDASLNDDVIKISKEAYDTFQKIILYQQNPLFIIDDEQIQFEKIVPDSELNVDLEGNHYYSIVVFRSVNNTLLTNHYENSKIYIIPYKNLYISILDKLIGRDEKTLKTETWNNY